jgi:hypothetical protein
MRPVPLFVRTFLWRWNTRTLAMPHTNQAVRCLAPSCTRNNGHIHTIFKCDKVARIAQVLTGAIAVELGRVADRDEFD